MQGVERYAAAVGRRIHSTKTKVFSAQVAVTQQKQLFLEEVSLEEVVIFKYLGASFTTARQAVQEVGSRIKSAWMAFYCLQTALWPKREISHKAKSRDYAAVVRTTLL